MDARLLSANKLLSYTKFNSRIANVLLWSYGLSNCVKINANRHDILQRVIKSQSVVSGPIMNVTSGIKVNIKIESYGNVQRLFD